jgi:riboflavin synthase alpha subunit
VEGHLVAGHALAAGLISARRPHARLADIDLKALEKLVMQTSRAKQAALPAGKPEPDR